MPGVALATGGKDNTQRMRCRQEASRTLSIHPSQDPHILLSSARSAISAHGPRGEKIPLLVVFRRGPANNHKKVPSRGSIRHFKENARR